MKIRFFILIVFILGTFSFLGINLYSLQIEKGDYYSAKAVKLAGFLTPYRGDIYFTDKNSNTIPVAISKAYPVIFAVPKEIEDVDEATGFLVDIVGIDKEKLHHLLQKDSSYELLVKKASEDQVSKIRDLNFKGIYIEDQEFRFYPSNQLASQFLGYVGPDEQGVDISGKYGLELYFDEKLSGKAGVVKDKKIIKSVSGENIYLTIDRNIQTKAEEILANLVEKFSAHDGSFIVQEPKSGKILAMGGYPNFDPNNYSQAPLANFLNNNVQGVYEPGSVFKVLTMAAGIDSGAITPETTYYDDGSFEVRDRILKNWDLKAYGTVSMTQVIEHSLNTGAAFAEKKIGHKTFYDYLLKFGFSKSTQIDLPGELGGNLKNLSDLKNPVNFATAAFGQGISVTPIQLISAVSAIANGGYLMRPTILTKDEPEEVTTVITPDTSKKVTVMMENALKKAELGRVEKYRLAGKTGTAQVSEKGKYTKDVINTYVGFGPVSDPKFTILFKLSKPAGAPLAGQTVVPAFRELAQFILSYYNISPDDL